MDDSRSGNDTLIGGGTRTVGNDPSRRHRPKLAMLVRCGATPAAATTR
jgi:hypothetical protein